MPSAALRRLVDMRAEMDGERHVPQGFIKAKVGRSGEDRIGANDDQRVDCTRTHRIDEVADRPSLIDRLRLDRRDVAQRRPHRAELSVDEVRKGVRLGRLLASDMDERGAPMLLQIVGHRQCPRRGGASDALVWNGAERCSDGVQRDEHLLRPDRPAMVGHGAGERRDALDGIEAAHPFADLGGAAARGKVPCIAQVARRAGQEIATHGEDDIRLVEIEDGVDSPVERQDGAGAHFVTGERLPLVPRRVRPGFSQRRDLRR